MSIECVKKELKDLCIEYILILEKLKNSEIISHDEFEEYASDKLAFVEE